MCVWSLVHGLLFSNLSPSSFAIIFMGRRELVALRELTYWCILIVSILWLFLVVPRVGLQCVIVVFPDHTP